MVQPAALYLAAVIQLASVSLADAVALRIGERFHQSTGVAEDAEASHSAASSPSTAASFCNPLNLNYRFQLDSPSRREAADPTMVVFRDRYFLFASKSGGYWHSPDLVAWTFVEPQGLPLEDYAPTAVVIGDQMFYTASDSQGIFATASPAEGNWTKVASIDKYWDPALLLDDDGKVYLSWGCSNASPIRVVQLDPDNGWKVVGEPVVAAFGDPALHGWERYTDWRARIIGTQPFIEGSWINKVGGRYYLQYAAPGTEMQSYGDGAFVSDKPLGPYTRDRHSPISHKPTGFIAGAGHGSTFQDLHGRWWHVATGIVNVRHNMERRVMLFPAYFNSSTFPRHLRVSESGDAPSILVDTTFGDFPMRTDQTRPGWQLLSLGKKTTASSTLIWHSQPPTSGLVGWWHSPPPSRPVSYAPANAVDEDVRTWWSAAANGPGEWLAVDLGAAAAVHALQVNLADEGASVLGRLRGACRYYAEGSADGETWEPIAELDRRHSNEDMPHDFVELARPIRLQHLRVTSTYVPGGARFSLSDLRVFGFGAGAAPDQVNSVEAVRDAQNPQQAAVSWRAADGAQYYIVRYGLEHGPAFHNHQVYGNTSLQITELSLGETYRFLVDAVNEAGWTAGVKQAIA